MFLRQFGNKEDIEKEFDKKGILDDAEVLFAYYSYEDYSGDSLVVYSKDGKFFEVNGGHCSCYGLEGQWSPEETTLEAIYQRMFTGDDLPYWLREDPEIAAKLKETLEQRIGK